MHGRFHSYRSPEAELRLVQSALSEMVLANAMTPGIVHAAARSPHLPADDANTYPLVSFARNGAAAHWKAPACESILELAEACDVPVRWSCRTGVVIAVKAV
jgi:hypothetical protein